MPASLPNNTLQRVRRRRRRRHRHRLNAFAMRSSSALSLPLPWAAQPPTLFAKMVRWGNHTHTHTHTRIQTLAHIQQRRSHWPAEVSDLICDRHLLTVWLVSMQTTTAAAAAGEQSVWAAAQSLLALLLFNQLKNKLHSWKCSQSRKMLSETLLSYYTPLQLALHLLF